ncbi:hypothetical protein DV515_00008992 [Chloebia gouldiae]|uniref:Uncharacterized protein n=1 Tax=Chloebia gouldiae TaxID=44316 RepID=A0A3L8SDG9_CHLGU|nr:hypothetical protein DV515_00008992 [Chloebia gouldiae]
MLAFLARSRAVIGGLQSPPRCTAGEPFGVLDLCFFGLTKVYFPRNFCHQIAQFPRNVFGTYGGTKCPWTHRACTAGPQSAIFRAVDTPDTDVTRFQFIE